MYNNDVPNMTDWSISDLVEISFSKPDDFLVIAETLTRIGITRRNTVQLTQIAHILHIREHYYIAHYKELYLHDRRPAHLTGSDIQRRNLIAVLLSDWGLCEILNPERVTDCAPLKSVKIVHYRDKHNWDLVSKYSFHSTRQNLNVDQRGNSRITMHE